MLSILSFEIVDNGTEKKVILNCFAQTVWLVSPSILASMVALPIKSPVSNNELYIWLFLLYVNSIEFKFCLEYRSSSEGEERGSEFSSKANSGIEETKKLSKKDTSRRDSRYVQLFQNIPLDCRVYSEKSL